MKPQHEGAITMHYPDASCWSGAPWGHPLGPSLITPKGHKYSFIYNSSSAVAAWFTWDFTFLLMSVRHPMCLLVYLCVCQMSIYLLCTRFF